MLQAELAPAWHDFLTVLAGLPDPVLEEGPGAGAVLQVRAAQELLLQAAVDRRTGAFPELARQPLENLPAVVRHVAAGLDPVPPDLAWTLLVDQGRDVAAALEEPEVADHPETMALARVLALDVLGEAGRTLRTLHPGPPPGLIFHLVPLHEWVSRTSMEYRAASLETEGFIHCTREPPVVEEVAMRYFASARAPLGMLVLDLARLVPEVRWEGAPHRYPHVYGPLNPDAVRDVRCMDRDPSGRWRFPWF